MGDGAPGVLGKGVPSFRRAHLNQWRSEGNQRLTCPGPMPARVSTLAPGYPPSVVTLPPLCPRVPLNFPGIQLTCPVHPPQGTREPISRQGEAALWWRKYCVLVPAVLLPLWGPGPQNVTWQSLSLPICEMRIWGPVCSAHFIGLF